MKKPQVHIGLVNPKSPENVGAVLRAAANYDIAQMFYTGERYPRAIERQARTIDMHRKVSQDVQLSQQISLTDAIADNIKSSVSNFR